MDSDRASQHIFFGASAILFIAGGASTIALGSSMSMMGGMAMPGGWTMSMIWMTGADWLAATAEFLGMWVVMMVAMMMPSLVPMLWRYRQSAPTSSGNRLAWLTILAGLGYFFVWTVFGLAIFPLGIGLATAEMHMPALARAVPVAIGVVLLTAGGLQFTVWKARQLACCREARGCGTAVPASGAAAWRQGIRFGLHCTQCCLGLMTILLVIGVMDLRAMLVVAVAITLERLAPAGELIARITGLITVAVGLFLVAQGAGLT